MSSSTSSSTYGGLDTTSPSKADRSSTAAAGDDVGWLHVPGKKNKKGKSSDANDNEETQSLASTRSRKIHALEMGAAEVEVEDVDSDASCETDDEDYELTDRAPTLSDHLSGRTTLLSWRPKERLRCLTLFVLSIMGAAIFAYVKRNDVHVSTLRRPPGAVGVGHASYDALHSSFIEEYDARLTLYRHRATGAEFLAFVPDTTRSGPNHSTGGDGGGYDPKPDKVFGVAFRTKPESSTGVPHILERESISLFAIHMT